MEAETRTIELTKEWLLQVELRGEAEPSLTLFKRVLPAGITASSHDALLKESIENECSTKPKRKAGKAVRAAIRKDVKAALKRGGQLN